MALAVQPAVAARSGGRVVDEAVARQPERSLLVEQRKGAPVARPGARVACRGDYVLHLAGIDPQLRHRPLGLGPGAHIGDQEEQAIVPGNLDQECVGDDRPPGDERSQRRLPLGGHARAVGGFDGRAGGECDRQNGGRADYRRHPPTAAEVQLVRRDDQRRAVQVVVGRLRADGRQDVQQAQRNRHAEQKAAARQTSADLPASRLRAEQTTNYREPQSGDSDPAPDEGARHTDRERVHDPVRGELHDPTGPGHADGKEITVEGGHGQDAERQLEAQNDARSPSCYHPTESSRFRDRRSARR